MKRNLFRACMIGLLFSITSCITAAPKESGKVIHINYADFNKKIVDVNGNEFKFLGDKPCIIDFYATWCGPCKMLSPHLDALAKQYAGKIDIYKVDIDQEKELGKAFGAYSIPLIIFVPKNGQPMSHRGYMDKAGLEKAIQDVLLGNTK